MLNITENRKHSSTLIVSQIRELELDEDLPYVCFNKSNVAPDPKKTYGLFTRDIVPRCKSLAIHLKNFFLKLFLSDPIHNVTIAGNNWIKHGEMLNLDFKCSGSPSPGFFECINLYDDIHNVTDNETCKSPPSRTDQCAVSFQHYYGDLEKHTVVVIIWNDVSRQVARTVVNIYKGMCFLLLVIFTSFYI